MTESNRDMTASETDITSELALPEPTGEYAVGTTNYNFTDSEREETYTENSNDNREITAKVWYPSEEVPEADTAPYVSKELGGAIASGLEIPPDDFNNLVQSISTNSVADAPLAEAESEYPVLVFSHGFGDVPELNTVKAEELASQGYVVVGINHTYDSIANVFADGEVVPQSSIFDLESESELLDLVGEGVSIRAEDAQFVLDELEQIDAGKDPKELFSNKLDLERLGIYGYSLGGATAAKVLSEDPRFQAGINLDGGLFGDSGEASLSQPFMIQNNEAFGTGNSSDARINEFDRIQQSFVDNLQNDGYEVTILGTEHSSFNDLSFLFPLLANSGIELGELEDATSSDGSGDEDFEPIDPQLSSQIINDYTVAFFEQYLNGESSSLLADDMSSPYPEVVFQAYLAENTTAEADASEADSTDRSPVAEGEDNAVHVNDAGILGTGAVLVGGAESPKGSAPNVASDRFFSNSDGGATFTGAGSADEFWVAVAGTPNSPNTVTDFNEVEDVIGIAGLGIGFNDLNISQQENNALIEFDGKELAVLQGTNADSLGVDNFIFA